nr:hypothetical protein [Frankia sp. Cj3]
MSYGPGSHVATPTPAHDLVKIIAPAVPPAGGSGGFHPGIASSVDGDNEEFREFRDAFRSRSATRAVPL